MSPPLATRRVASKALSRSPRLECPSTHYNTRSPPTCAFSTKPTNRRAKAPNSQDSAAPNEKPAKVRVAPTTSERSAVLQQRLQEKSANLARNREEQLREARQRRLDRIKEERGKRAQAEGEEKKELTKEEVEKQKKEDYKRRYKELEWRWLKFIVGMPIFLVMSYDLFQRLVMKREQKIPPWKQAKINKEKEEKEKREKLEQVGEEVLKDRDSSQGHKSLSELAVRLGRESN
ncbi:hypothetical protein SNK03_008918 [Fusarium graminearum]|uniref:Uncharacterized protein n=1 Tax=Gibberella zeae TaxID=5518 RepID=A0A2H3HF27_GIBZA|nr:hypothetical protein FGRA07_02201 [Fusarium graminearum]CAF3448371.1 unnamed protein product [Fusarium graminearum]CAF3453480.1 unnamed protein product [Fusarium graminearum]CAG1983701.1 unnamed protein product [Fusarium graminearum]CAG1991289.1 unnamed protein product [Fusarium graminearum]